MSAWTRAEITALVERQLAGWPAVERAAWARHAVEPFPVPWHRVSCQLGGDEVFVLARAGDTVLVYDCVEEEFGIGRLDQFGVLRDFVESDAQLGCAQRWFLDAVARTGAS